MNTPQDKSTETEEDIKSLPLVLQIMSRMHKSQHVQDYLEAIKTALIEDRAFQTLDWSQDKLHKAAAASGFSHGQLLLITNLCDYGHVIQE